jgi:hypothetical protein
MPTISAPYHLIGHNNSLAEKKKRFAFHATIMSYATTSLQSTRKNITKKAQLNRSRGKPIHDHHTYLRMR